MSRARDLFLEEAGECLSTLSLVGEPAPETAEILHDAARRLRGSAQMARFGRIAEEAGLLEEQLRGIARDGFAPDETVIAELVDRTAGIAEAVADVRSGRIEQDTPTEKPMQEDQPVGAGETALDDLEYRGQAALERAHELRAALEDAIRGDDSVDPILDEIFDLIRLGMK